MNGDSPSDFPEEHYERSWPDRFKPEELNETGRRGFGLVGPRSRRGPTG